MKYKSCNLLEHGLCFYSGVLSSCCYLPQVNSSQLTYISPIYNGEKINSDLLFSKIKRWRENAKNGKYLKQCINCCQLEEKDWDEEFYINQVYITHFETCNLNCIYCINEKKLEYKEPYKILPVLEDLKEKNIINKGCEFHIGGGEFSIYEESEELIEKFVMSGFCKRFSVATNGIKFSQKLFEAMCQDKACIIVSVDCGSANMYKKIKGVDAFYKLKESLNKYTQNEMAKQNTFLKYIIIPKINDNKKEFISFLDFAKEIGIKGIKLDIEGRYVRNNNYNLNKKITEYISWARSYSIEKGFDVEFSSFYNQFSSTIS